jgi:hypothetical protein
MQRRPLVLDVVNGVPQVLGDGDVLFTGGRNGSVGGFHHGGGWLGFFGRQGLAEIPQLYGVCSYCSRSHSSTPMSPAG